ncbi:MAG: response regulator [Magnetococcales bacterium]|nr:response regulator [Magnetococcales bacterium]
MTEARAKILVVDDKPANIVAVQTLLKDMDIEIIEALSGNEALQICILHDLALILLDVRMPHMNGFEVASLLRGLDRTRTVPIIFITAAHSDELHELHGYDVGAVDFLHKPINDQILRSKVTVFMELFNLRRDQKQDMKLLEKRRLQVENEIIERKKVEKELKHHRDNLSNMVRERTAELEQAQDELRDLAGHLNLAREKERQWIAQEIHDELGNNLANLKMGIQWFKSKPCQEQTSYQNQLGDLLDQVNATIRKVRQITLLLRPPVLDQFGLLTALEWQAKEFEKSAGYSCRIHPDSVDMDIEEQQKLALFRICQESLTNISRHAEATQVEIRLIMDKDWIQLSISDNGKGTPEALSLNPNRSLGLRGMAERARQNQGTMKLTTTPGKGTKITVRIPTSNKE